MDIAIFFKQQKISGFFKKKIADKCVCRPKEGNGFLVSNIAKKNKSESILFLDLFTMTCDAG